MPPGATNNDDSDDAAPHLSPDSDNVLTVYTQEDLDELLSGRSTAKDVRKLVIGGSVRRIPADWSALPRLQSLTLHSYRNILESFSALHGSSLPSLQELALDGPITWGMKLQCPVLAGPFPRLHSLRLSYFSLEGDGLTQALLEPAGQRNALPSLTTLELQDNGMGEEGCAALARALESKDVLPSLTHLELGGNHIGEEGCAALARGLLRARSALQSLSLNSNKLSALPDDLGLLSSLTSLFVFNNNITKIQPALYGLILRLEVLYAKGNPLQSPPVEVVSQGLEALQNYLREAQRSGVQALRVARVTLVGDTMHGKTTLCRSLLGGAPDRNVKPEQRTHALEIHDWAPQEGVAIKLWDFAGHDVYYATHRCFFSRLCIYVLVVKIPIDGAAMRDAVRSSVDWMMSICRAVPAKAQVVVVGTFFREERQHSHGRLLGNLWELVTKLRAADESRVRDWNGSAQRSAQGRAEAADIVGAHWVDCHSDEASNLPVLRAQIMELAETMVQQHQSLTQTYIATLQAHQELFDAGSAGIALFEDFFKRANSKQKNHGGGDLSENVVKEALTFASDVGLLQYYRGINERIIFINPLFLVQAFGVLIYDRAAYDNFIKDDSSPKYVFHGKDNSIWEERLYRRGILRKSEVSSVWEFAPSDCFSSSLENRDERIRTLIQVLEELDLVFEHQGLLPSREEYYLVPEVWTRRFQGPNGKKCTAAEADPAAYDPHQHVTVGRKIEVEGGRLPPVLFPRFLCKCANVLKRQEDHWADGRITLGTDSLRWESAAWPAGPGALTLWLQRETTQVVVFKVAGLGGERERVRRLYGEVGSVIEEMLEEERVCKTRQELGIKPLSKEPRVEIEWMDKEDFESWRTPPGSNPDATFNRRWGVKASTPLYYFGQDDGDDSSFDPNFEEELLLRKREAGDPEFVLHHSHADSECPPQCRSKIDAAVSAVMDDQQRLLTDVKPVAWQWKRRKTLPRQEEIDKRIRIINLAQSHGDERMSRVNLCLYVCHPLRNLYLKSDTFHSSILADFCAEMMRLFQVLRAKQVKITISSKSKFIRKTKGMLDVVFGKGEACSEGENGGEYRDTWVRDFRHVLNPSEKGFPVKEQLWFFLDSSSPSFPESFYGFGFERARRALLDMKKHRMEYESFDQRSFTVSCKQSDENRALLSLINILGTGSDSKSVEETSCSFECNAKGYNWSEKQKLWI